MRSLASLSRNLAQKEVGSDVADISVRVDESATIIVGLAGLL